MPMHKANDFDKYHRRANDHYHRRANSQDDDNDDENDESKTRITDPNDPYV